MSVGTLLGGRYELLTSLGHGGFGTVWRAHDRTLGRDVAVKLITLDTARPGTREEIAERFEREARAVAGLNHPNIVTAHDYGVENGTAYLVMELIGGGSLEDELAAREAAGVGPLDPSRVVSIGTQVAAGLAAAHAAGLIHRDLKPANVMNADADGHVKIVDFGIARVADRSRITQTGMYLGTLRYTSPEQMGAGPVDPRSDLYSLGCMLFELVAGRSPYQAETPLQWMAAHQYASPARVRTYAPFAPVELEVLIDRMLAKAPDGRPASAADVRRALDEIARELAAGAVPGAAVSGAAPVTPQPRPPQPTPASGPVNSQVAPPHSTPSPYQHRPAVIPQPPPAGPPPGYPPSYPLVAYPGSHPTGYPMPARPRGGGRPGVPVAWPPQYPPGAPPGTLLAASRLLRLTAVLSGILLLLYIVAYHQISTAWSAAYDGITTGSAEPALGMVFVGFAIVAQVVGALLLSRPIGRGHPVGRVLGWIFIVLNLLCCVVPFVGVTLFTPPTDEFTTSNQAVIDAARVHFGSGYPVWLTAMNATVAVLGIAALIGAAVTMSLRPSSAYFRAMAAMRRVTPR
ncbi:MAG TPA: serine/threonine-protein kinase [Micromonosporaceae bacterium]|nr:serine/threonine-protein kinase [Micromonosporaceae bacterium]